MGMIVIIIAPSFLTVPAQDCLRYNMEWDSIARYFDVNSGTGTSCSDIEIAHYPSLLRLRSLLEDDRVEFKAPNDF
jgi:hypothetical protein